MGQFLYFNIATKIIVSKKHHFSNKSFTKDEILRRLSRNFNMELFDVEEYDDYLQCVLKDEMTKKYLCSFLEEHTQYYGREDVHEEIEKLKDMGPQEVINYITNEDIDYIYFNNYDYLQYHYLDDKLKIYLEGIFYLSEGKILLECCYHMFRYIHQLIRAPHHNPLEEATYLTII